MNGFDPSLEWPLVQAMVFAVLVAAMAQVVIRIAVHQTRGRPARMSGFAAARRMLDAAELPEVTIEQVPGTFSDHYEPRHRVLRLSGTVYHGRSLAAIGIATHEAAHAVQHADGDLRVRVLGLAGIAASFGSGAGIVLLLLGIVFRPLAWLGACVFCGAVCFQALNLPGELNASRRARKSVFDLQLVDDADLAAVCYVINAASLTYVAVTLQTVISSVMGILRYMSRGA